MKTPRKNTNSQARIFGLALKSALDPPVLPRKDSLASEKNLRLVEATASTLTHLHESEKNTFVHNMPLYFEGYNSTTKGCEYGLSPSCNNEIRPPVPRGRCFDQEDIRSLVHSNHKMMYEEALRMDANSEKDLWVKENRLKALQNIERHSLEQYSSTSSLSSYKSGSTGRMSEDMLEPSNFQLDSLQSLSSRSASMISESMMGFIDSHCHLDILLQNEHFSGTYSEYMVKHRKNYPDSYKGCIAVFCKPFTFAKVSMWEKHLAHENVWGAFGVHPKNAREYDSKIEKFLISALNHPKVKALGEIGLDYSDRNTSSKSKQHEVFRRQLQIAYDRRLPIVIHCREAEDDTIRILHEILPKNYAFHLHCFTGNWKSAQRWMKEFPSVFIGITNLVTFPSATATHEVAKKLPCDRLLLETDAPYFVPRVFPKGEAPRCSHPGMAIHVATKIAELKNMPLGKILQCTQANTKFVYRLP